MTKQEFKEEKTNDTFSYEMAFEYFNEHRKHLPEMVFKDFENHFRDFLSHADKVIIAGSGQPKRINIQRIKELLYNYFDKKFEDENINVNEK